MIRLSDSGKIDKDTAFLAKFDVLIVVLPVLQVKKWGTLRKQSQLLSLLPLPSFSCLILEFQQSSLSCGPTICRWD